MDNFPRLFDEPDDNLFLFGPRGTGKSTLLKGRRTGEYCFKNFFKNSLQKSYMLILIYI